MNGKVASPSLTRLPLGTEEKETLETLSMMKKFKKVNLSEDNSCEWISGQSYKHSTILN